MRILIVNYEFPPIGAGGGKASFNIAASLVEMGHRVRVITARPIEVYSYLGTFSLILGIGIGGWLAYQEITVNIDIGGEGFTTIAVLLVLSGLMLRVMGLMWGLVVPYKGLPRREFIDGVEVRRVPAFRQRRESSSVLEMFSFLISGSVYGLRHVSSFKPDIVHIFFGIPCGPIGWLIKHIHDVPYIISLRGADVPSEEVQRFKRLYALLKPFVRMLWRDADALVAVSNGLRDIALQTDDVYIQVIPNAIDLSRFKPRVAWDQCEIEDGTVRMLFVGRLIRFKNVGTLLDVVALVKEKSQTPFVLEIVGDGAERPKLEEQAADLGLAPNVRFYGWIDRSEIAAYYQKADLFITASVWEGMPNTVLEAMACGLPIIASDVQGSEELVQHGTNGYLVPIRDARSMAEAVLLLLDNEFERRRMGRESRRIVQSKFSWDHIAREYVIIYDQHVVRKDING